MDRLRIAPRSIGAIIIAILISAFVSLGTAGHVGASQTPVADDQPEVNADCGSWRSKTVQVTHSIPGGAQGFTTGVRWNNCRVEGRWIDCGGHTTIFSVGNTKCFFHRVSTTKIHAAYDYTLCSTPIFGVGVCYDEYMRLVVTSPNGALSYVGNGAPALIRVL